MPLPLLFRTTTSTCCARSLVLLPLTRVRTARYYTTDEKGRLVEQWFDAFRNKKIIEQDLIAPSQFNLMGNTMNHPVYSGARLPDMGTELPPAWHLAYFPPRVLEEDLSSDGYEQEWKPPSPFNHRMWAGGELKWNPDNPLRVGDVAQMESSLRDVQFRPAGRRGDSVFIWVDKHISNAKGWAMTESRCWVYVEGASPIKEKSPTQAKAAAAAAATAASPPSSSQPPAAAAAPELPQADFSLELVPSPILLFRFSALTFNSHLIHYDHLYATNIEHHRGCLVHGPMSFMLMVNQLNEHLKEKKIDKVIKSFKYRCRSPLVVNEPLKVQGKASSEHQDQYELWVADHQGNQAVKGTAIVG